jgi:hypothetical protein
MKDERRKALTKFTAFLCGVAAWAAVAGLSVVIAFNIGSKNQVLMFLPIIAAVFGAWAVGEIVTSRVLSGTEGEK